MVDTSAAKTVAPATVEPPKTPTPPTPPMVTAANSPGLNSAKPQTFVPTKAPDRSVAADAMNHGQVTRPGQNISDNSPGSFDHATASRSANVGFPGANRTVVGVADSAAGQEPVWAPSEHMTIAEEQRLRSEAYVKDINRYHAQRRSSLVDPTMPKPIEGPVEVNSGVVDPVTRQILTVTKQPGKNLDGTPEVDGTVHPNPGNTTSSGMQGAGAAIKSAPYIAGEPSKK